MDLKPLADRVIVQPLEAEETSKGGIVLPETAKEKPQEGKVIAVGAGKKSDAGAVQKPELKKGDRILYGKYSGTEISFEDNDYLIMRESDIVAII